MGRDEIRKCDTQNNQKPYRTFATRGYCTRNSRQVDVFNGFYNGHKYFPTGFSPTMHPPPCRDLLVEADCLQEVQADVFPVQIVESDCKFFYKDVRVPMLP